jgi:putative ABC transport system permease protein
MSPTTFFDERDMLLAVMVALLVGQAPGELPGLLIERRLAEDLPASVGDTVFARALASEEGGAFVVEGIFERPADPNRIARNEYEVRFHLPDLEAMLPVRDRVDRFAVALRPGFRADSLARWVEGLAYGTQVFDAAALAEETSTTFRVVSRFHDAIGFVTILASGIFLLCLMVIRVDERRGDVRTLRLVGISRRTVLKTIVLEAVAVAATASVVGALIGIALSHAVNVYYAGFYDTTLRFAIVTPRIVVISAGLGLVLGVAAGVLAALRVVRVPPQRLGER